MLYYLSFNSICGVFSFLATAFGWKAKTQSLPHDRKATTELRAPSLFGKLTAGTGLSLQQLRKERQKAQVQGQPGLSNELKANLGNIVKPCIKIKSKNKDRAMVWRPEYREY